MILRLLKKMVKVFPPSHREYGLVKLMFLQSTHSVPVIYNRKPNITYSEFSLDASLGHLQLLNVVPEQPLEASQLWTIPGCSDSLLQAVVRKK